MIIAARARACTAGSPGLRGVAPGNDTVLSSEQEIGEAFGTGEPFTIGVEEELFLVDPVTGRQINASRGVLDRLGPVNGTVERELHACQVELITGVCRTAADAVGSLRGLRRAVAATGAGLLGSGTHPTQVEGDAEITDKERYERIRHLLGDAVATPVAGLHIHVGMPDAETAIRVFNGLRCRRSPRTRRSGTAATPASPRRER